jgi:hypothetical protein
MADLSVKGLREPIVDPVAHFWSNVDRSGGPDACWPWLMSIVGTTGYGQYHNKMAGRSAAHTYAYRQAIGPVPEGHQVDHTCHNSAVDCAGGKTCLHRQCCNPAHLEAVPGAENQRRADAPRNRGAQKTHCINGHLYDEANTCWIKVDRRGKMYDVRRCRVCNRDRVRARKFATE